MKAWKLPGQPESGHWTLVGSAEDLLTCRGDGVPVKADREGLPLCLPVARLGPYSTVQLPVVATKNCFTGSSSKTY